MIDAQLISIGLFAGAFGLDLGMEQAGFHTVSVVEIDPDSTKTIALNRPYLSASAIPRDICSLNAQTLLEEGGRVLDIGRSLRSGEVDLITGGPPCQPFSTAGKRMSVGDPRGSLFKDFIRIIKEVQPRFFVMENVRGLLSAPIRHRPHNQRGLSFPALETDEMQGSALNVVLAEIKSIGYKVAYRLLQAADYGVPQTRWRVIFIASRDGERVTFPQPTHDEKGANALPKWRTLKKGLESLVDPQPEYTSYSKNRLKYLSLLKAGQNWRFLPEHLKKEAMGGAYQSGGGKVGFYRRLSWDKPSPTITTSPHQKATDMCHPKQLRPLTVKECARIQTFPDEWIFYGSVASKYRQIGNAVPVLLAKAIGEHIYKLCTKEAIQGANEPLQLSIFECNNFVKATKTNLSSKTFRSPLTVMTEKEILSTLFKDAGVKRSALLTEKINTLDRYIEISEEELQNIQWVDKKGKYIQMVKNNEIDKLITKRDLYLNGIREPQEQKNKLHSTSIWLSHIPLIKNLLKYFVSSRKASIIAQQIRNIEKIKVESVAFSKALDDLSDSEKENIVNLFLQKNQWNYAAIKKYPQQVNILAATLRLRAKLHQQEVSIESDEAYLNFKLYLLKNWYRLQVEPQLLLEDASASIFLKNEKDRQLMNIATNLFKLDEKKVELTLLFLSEIIRMENDIPKIAQEAILTGNPFLFRSLFLDFQEAEQFAVVGKLNSSLETKYGNLFEKLMAAFGNCREVYDGGVDVVIEENAFDIKSGPNVMNKSMVDAFLAKQILIEDKKLLPDINTYKIALGYGKKEKINSFMASIDSEIITAREAWSQITGIEYSPEIVFAIAGLAPRILGVKSVVGSMLGQSQQYVINKAHNSQFSKLFSNSFEPINLSLEAQTEINKINSILN